MILDEKERSLGVDVPLSVRKERETHQQHHNAPTTPMHPFLVFSPLFDWNNPKSFLFISTAQKRVEHFYKAIFWPSHAASTRSSEAYYKFHLSIFYRKIYKELNNNKKHVRKNRRILREKTHQQRSSAQRTTYKRRNIRTTFCCFLSGEFFHRAMKALTCCHLAILISSTSPQMGRASSYGWCCKAAPLHTNAEETALRSGIAT